MTPAEKAELQDYYRVILDTGTLILGPFTKRFEDEFANYIGTRYAVSVNSGTSALEILCRIHGFKGKKIGVPTNTNFATVAAIIRAGGEPVYLDMSVETYCPTLEMVKAAHQHEKITGLLWVHIGGIITPDFDKIVEYCKTQHIILIEDAAHAHGSEFKQKKAGNFADGGAFSFFPTKVMTTYEGGMITTNDEDVMQLAKSYRNQGKGSADYGNYHTEFGNSWRMLEVSAALGLIQLRKLDHMLDKRQQVVEKVIPILKELKINYCDTSHMNRASNYKFIIRHESSRNLAEIKESFKQRGVILGGGVYEIPCHLQPVFKAIKIPNSGLATAEKYCPRQICLPITSGLSTQEEKQLQEAIYQVM